MLGSLERLAALPGNTLVCCGHEYTEANGRFAAAAEAQNPARDARLAEVARLRAAGVHFRNDIVTGPGGRQIVLDDPSGNPVELFQPGAGK